MPINKQASEMGYRHSVVNTSMWTFVQKMVLHIGAFFTTMYLTRMLRTDEYGLITLVNSFVLFCLALVGLGVPNALARFLAAEEDRAAQRVVLFRGVLALLPWALIALGVLVVCFPDIAGFLGEPRLGAMKWIFICVLVLELVRVFVEKICHGISNMKITAGFSAWTTVTLLMITVPVVWQYPTATAALWAKVAALTIPTIRVLLSLRKLLQGGRAAVERELPKGGQIFRYGVPLTAISLSVFGFVQSDILMIAYFGDASMVGVYAVSVFLFARMAVVARAIGYGVSPLFASSKVNPHDAAKWFFGGLKYALVISLPIAIFAVVEGEALMVLLFGEKYAESAGSLAILSVYFILMSILSVVNPVLDFSGKATTRAVATFAGALINIVLNIALIPRLGIIGAALATVIGYSVLFGVATLSVFRVVQISRQLMTPLICLVLCVAPMMLIILVGVRILNTDASPWINAVLICSLYPVSLYALGIARKDEFKVLQARIKGAK